MRAEKQLLLDDIKRQIDTSEAFVIFNYLRLKATAATEFRDQMHEIGGHVEMMPKRLLQKAGQELQLEIEDAMLDGHVGLAFTSGDSVELAKLLVKFAKDSGAVNVLGGRFDGTLYDADSVAKLSKLPSIDGMRSQLLGLFQAPMAQTLSVMNALLCSVCYALENKAKLEGGEE